MEGRTNQSSGGLAFVACMFIGAGIGMLFHKTVAGGIIGMGIGFLAMAFIRNRDIKTTPTTIGFPLTFGRIILAIIGLILIAWGLSLVFKICLLFPYGVGIGLVLLGLFILISALFKWKENK
jgi:hypothetical protein